MTHITIQHHLDMTQNKDDSEANMTQKMSYLNNILTHNFFYSYMAQRPNQ